MEIVSRKDWGAVAPKSVTPWNVADLFGICFHHFGEPRAAASHAGCDDLLRSVQKFHMAPGGLGVKDGGADIAYNFGICPHDVVFELRGWDHQTGANGTTFSNEHYLAVVYMGHSDLDGFPEHVQDVAGELFAAAFKKGINRDVVPHRKFTGSECPGDAAHAWVVGGGWRADLPAVKQVRFELWDDAAKVEQSAKVPLAASKAKLRSFLDNKTGAIHRSISDEGKVGGVRLVRRVFS